MFGPARRDEDIEIGDARPVAKKIRPRHRVGKVAHPRGNIGARDRFLLRGAIVPVWLEALVDFGRAIGERLDQPRATARAFGAELRKTTPPIVPNPDITG